MAIGPARLLVPLRRMESSADCTAPAQRREPRGLRRARYDSRMPIYEYTCASCEHRFEELVWATDARRLPRVHVAGRREAALAFSPAPAAATSRARRGGGGGGCCGGGCGCSGSARRCSGPAPGQAAPTARSRPRARRWSRARATPSGLMLVADAPGLLDDRWARRLPARPATCSTSSWSQQPRARRGCTHPARQVPHPGWPRPARGRDGRLPGKARRPDRARTPARRLPARDLATRVLTGRQPRSERGQSRRATLAGHSASCCHSPSRGRPLQPRLRRELAADLARVAALLGTRRRARPRSPLRPPTSCRRVAMATSSASSEAETAALAARSPSPCVRGGRVPARRSRFGQDRVRPRSRAGARRDRCRDEPDLHRGPPLRRAAGARRAPRPVPGRAPRRGRVRRPRALLRRRPRDLRGVARRGPRSAAGSAGRGAHRGRSARICAACVSTPTWKSRLRLCPARCVLALDTATDVATCCLWRDGRTLAARDGGPARVPRRPCSCSSTGSSARAARSAARSAWSRSAAGPAPTPACASGSPTARASRSGWACRAAESRRSRRCSPAPTGAVALIDARRGEVFAHGRGHRAGRAPAHAGRLVRGRALRRRRRAALPLAARGSRSDRAPRRRPAPPLPRPIAALAAGPTRTRRRPLYLRRPDARSSRSRP